MIGAFSGVDTDRVRWTANLLQGLIPVIISCSTACLPVLDINNFDMAHAWHSYVVVYRSLRVYAQRASKSMHAKRLK